MKLVNVRSGTYIDFDLENSDKDLKFAVVNHVRIGLKNCRLV